MRLFPIVSLLGAILLASPALAANAVVRDGDTIQLGDVTYRLDGVDAPELDQICINDQADPWSCGIDARDQLTKLIGGRDVHCDDVGPDKLFSKRRAGVCTIAGDSTSLNQQIAQMGLAISVEPSLKVHAGDDAAKAQADKRGLWKGCFVAPQEFRLGKKDGALIGGSCRADRDREIRSVLFPEDFAMPPSCAIKAKFALRARVTGNVGVYQLQGCRTYAGLTKPDRWFCSEDDAKAAGFRRAFNCRAPKPASK
ncbi:MAG: thermonuclease family protein [Bradyrhizobium sp.]|nr:thermonuclease family protein [Bradyrhizobium sp.]